MLYSQGGRYVPSIPLPTYLLAVPHLALSLYPYSVPGKILILIDSRASPGWPNPPATKMLPLIRDVNNLLMLHFPDRVERVILYPLPGIMRTVWNAISKLLEERNRKLILVLAEKNAMLRLQEFITLDAFPEDARDMHQGVSNGEG